MHLSITPPAGSIKTKLLLLLTAVAFIFGSCKKENAVDYPSLFNNTVWTGQLKHYGGGPQLFAVTFKGDGNLVWSEFGSLRQGTWQLEGSRLTIICNDYFSVEQRIDATVSNDKTLTDIKSSDPSALSVVSAQINNFTKQAVEGTTWRDDQLSISFINPKSVTYNSYPGLQGPPITASYIHVYGFIVFPDPPGTTGSITGQIQPDGKTMKIGAGANKWYTIVKQ